MTSRPQKKKKSQPGEEAASQPAYAIGAFIGLRGQNAFKIFRFGLGPDLTIFGSLNLIMMSKLEFRH
jgi:hypothetical protein